MIGTINCVYETPCGWCSKWDKKCDRAVGNTYITNVPNGTLPNNCHCNDIKTGTTYIINPQTIGQKI